jgi:pyridoxal phosphate-dependent aminotransferase EpsN
MGTKESAYVGEAFSSNWLSTVGPNLTALEGQFSELVGLPCVALGTGTAGVHLGLKLLAVGAGTEVVTPTLTFAASCNPLLYEGAVPVFIDSETRSWNLDPNLLSTFLRKRARTNQLPKAVTVVHLFGRSADLEPILEICERYEIPLLEDAAESLGAWYRGRHAGTIGSVGVFSFNGNKIITGTTGGMLVSPDPELVARARKWSTQSRDPDAEGINNYVHSELGYNYRMSNVVAGIVRGQLEVLEQRVQQRRAVFERYRCAFVDIPGIEPQPQFDDGTAEPKGQKTKGPQATGPREDQSFLPGRSCRPVEGKSRHTRWLSCFLIDEEEFGMSAPALIRFLDAANVEARPVWKPMHTQPLYRGYECIGGGVAEDLNRRGVCLPSSSCLNEEDQQFVIDKVREAHLKAKR